MKILLHLLITSISLRDSTVVGRMAMKVTEDRALFFCWQNFGFPPSLSLEQNHGSSILRSPLHFSFLKLRFSGYIK